MPGSYFEVLSRLQSNPGPVSDAFQGNDEDALVNVKHRLEQNIANECFVPSDFIVQKAMQPLDKMWHEFILFTQEYHKFCETFFGNYLHHVPCSEKEFQAFQQRKVERKENFEKLEREKLKVFVTYIQQNLGDETLETWFKQIPKLILDFKVV